jgi:acyl-CoA thioesterase-2
LWAAYATVRDRLAISLHGYFVQAGEPGAPIHYAVEPVRDGRSFSTRRVTAEQDGRPIFIMLASFQAEDAGLDHAAAPAPTPPPEAFSDFDDRLRQVPLPVQAYYRRGRPFDLRPVDFARYQSAPARAPHLKLWLRARTTLPDGQAMHHCALAYASDYTLLDTSLAPLGRSMLYGGIAAASLDHSLWFHRPFRADEWLLHAQESPSAHHSRGFTRGSFFSADGALVASVAQEGLIRDRSG